MDTQIHRYRYTGAQKCRLRETAAVHRYRCKYRYGYVWTEIKTHRQGYVCTEVQTHRYKGTGSYRHIGTDTSYSYTLIYRLREREREKEREINIDRNIDPATWIHKCDYRYRCRREHRSTQIQCKFLSCRNRLRETRTQRARHRQKHSSCTQIQEQRCRATDPRTQIRRYRHRCMLLQTLCV
jgi:hypothetical protein